MDVAGRTITFSLDTGATYSVLTAFSRLLSPKLALSWVWQESSPLRISFLLWAVSGKDIISCIPFLVVPECPTPIVRNQNSLVIGENPVLRPPLQMLLMQTEDHLNTLTPIWESQIDPAVWDTEIPGQTKNPSSLVLWIPHRFPPPEAVPSKA